MKLFAPGMVRTGVFVSALTRSSGASSRFVSPSFPGETFPKKGQRVVVHYVGEWWGGRGFAPTPGLALPNANITSPGRFKRDCWTD